MKIYGDYTFLLDKLNVWNDSQVKIADNGAKIVEFADKFLEEQRAASHDEVSISLEGMEYLRDRMSDFGRMNGGYYNNDENELQTMAADGLSLMDGFCRTYILQRLDSEGANGVSGKLYGGIMSRYEEELSGRETGEMSSHAESLARAYADMKKNIEEGYKNGIREVWTLDKSTGEDFSGVEFEIDGSAVRYRKLSKEEELENLDKAFDQLTKDVAEKFAQMKTEERARSGEELSDEEKEFWTLAGWTDGLIKEINSFLELIAREEEALKGKEEPEDIGTRLSAEMQNHGLETAARGKLQAQYENYRKISRMAADVQTLLGNIRA